MDLVQTCIKYAPYCRGASTEYTAVRGFGRVLRPLEPPNPSLYYFQVIYSKNGFPVVKALSPFYLVMDALKSGTPLYYKSGCPQRSHRAQECRPEVSSGAHRAARGSTAAHGPARRLRKLLRLRRLGRRPWEGEGRAAGERGVFAGHCGVLCRITGF